MNLSNAESIYIENKEVESIYITNKLAWENGTNINIDTPFKERTTANGTVISGTRAKVLSISGQSILFNQKCKKVNNMWFPEGLTFIGGSSDDDYIGARITDETKLSTSTNLPLAAEFFTPKKGHTYLYKIKIKCNFPNAACGFKIYNVASTQNYVYGDSWTEIVDIINVSDSPTGNNVFAIFPFRGGVPANGKEFYFKKEVQIFDLYEMLGTNTKFLGVANFTTATNKTAAITKFNELFNADCYAYNDGYAINFEGLLNTTFNQYSTPSSEGTVSGITISFDANNYVTINGTATADINRYGIFKISDYHYGVKPNHKIYHSILNISGTRTNTNYIIAEGYAPNTSALYENTTKKIFTLPASGNSTSHFKINNGDVYDNFRFQYMWIDLTAIFGAGNEPSTVEEFEAWMKKYGLNPNEFQNYTTGTTLYGTRINSTTSSSPSECKIPNVVLRRVGNVCDEIQGNKIIRRVGVVDLGSLSGVEKWNPSTNETFYARLYNKKCGSLEVMCDGFLKGEAGKYFAFVQAPNYNDLILRGTSGATNNYIYAKAIGYSLQNFITAVTGTKLYYELETPTEEDITWTNNYQCQNQGTEKILPYNTSMDGFSCLPIQCNVKYKH